MVACLDIAMVLKIQVDDVTIRVDICMDSKLNSLYNKLLYNRFNPSSYIRMYLAMHLSMHNYFYLLVIKTKHSATA